MNAIIETPQQSRFFVSWAGHTEDDFIVVDGGYVDTGGKVSPMAVTRYTWMHKNARRAAHADAAWRNYKHYTGRDPAI